MDNEYVKKLTGKNPQDFEFAAAHIVNDCDVEAFSALVEKSEFLFDFIKKNVEKRLSSVVNVSNYKNLLSFLKIYSADYEDFIISALVKFADEDLTDEMLDKFENGSDEEKAYCAKYFSRINDTLSIDLLRKYSYSEFDSLALNCAEALSAMNDEFSYNLAAEKIKSDDEFEKLSAAKFLVAFKDKKAIGILFESMKNSPMPENIASEIPYLQSFMELLDSDYKEDTILAINHIINGLGEILPLSQIFDFQLFEIFDKLITSNEKNSKFALVLLNAKLKFDQLTENDEYMFDEDKNTKQEIQEVKNLLNSQTKEIEEEQISLFQSEIDENSAFLFSALEIVQEINLVQSTEKLKTLLNSNNQTAILKTVEVIKSLNKINEIDKNVVLEKITDENIKQILISLFA